MGYAAMDRDREHLTLLAIFHYIAGGLTALVSLLPIVHVMLGLSFILMPQEYCTEAGRCPPPFFGWFFVTVAGFFILLGEALAVALILTGRSLNRQKNWLFCMVVAGLECAAFPFGTVLGVFTIMVLVRESVQARFGRTAPA